MPEHHIAAFAVDVADEFDVLVEEAVAGDFVSDHLAKGGGMEVGALLQLNEFRDDIVRSDDPAQAQAWGKVFEKVLK